MVRGSARFRVAVQSGMIAALDQLRTA
jgi:hypothetical protein